MPFAIRVASRDDAAAVGDLLETSYTALLPAGYDVGHLARLMPEIAGANPDLLSSGTYYLAETPDDLLVGCGGWSADRPGDGDVVGELGHIRHFACHPDWLGHGIGRALYERCEQDARAAGKRRFECNASLVAEGFYARSTRFKSESI